MKKLITAALLLLVWVGSAMGHYLTVDEQSTYIDVACDGYIFRCYYGNVETWDQVRNAGDTATLIYFYNQIYSSGTAYDIRFDLGSTLEVIEHTPTRVVLRKTAEFEDTNQNPLDASDVVVVHYYIYSDKIIMDLSWQDDATTTIDNSSNNYTMRVWVDGTSTINIGGDGGTEYCHTGGSCGNTTDLTSTEKSDYEYLGVECDELTLMYIDLNHTDDSDFQQYFGNTGVIGGQWNNNASFPSGEHRMVGVWIIDSADREGSAKLYTSTERLEMGDQWKDTTIADPTTGSWVDDLVIPANVGVDGFASDGALHVEPTSKEAEFTNDITRHKQAIVFEDPHIYTGDTVSGATDHLVGYWKCDDNAASTTIVASVGSNGTLQGGDNTEDKNNADAVQGTSLLLNGTDDYIDLSAAISDLADTDKFTISFDFKPNFAYDGSVQYIFYVGSSTSNNVYIRYRSIGDYYQISREIGGTPNSATAITDAFTSNEKLQQWTHFDVAIDLDNDMISVAINGAIVGVWNDSTAAWSATPTALWLGHFQSSAYCAGYFDNIALYDGALLPYGAFFTGNGSVDTDVAHDDITCFVKGDESNSDSLKIGTGTITVTNATHATGPDGVADSAFQVDANGEVVSFPGTEDTNVDFSQGSFSFWYKETGTIGSWGILFACTDSTSPSDNEFSFQRGTSDPDLYLKINSLDKNNTSMPNIFDGNWHFLAGRWSVAGDYAYVSVDGVEYELDSGSTYSGTPTISNSTFYIGSLGSANRHMGGAIYAFAITNNPNTPQIPTIMGKPVHVPLIEVE
jgi:hypothetical protein